MKTTHTSLVAAGSIIVGLLAAEMHGSNKANGTRPAREDRTVETVVWSVDDFRKQFQREGWSIHSKTRQKTNEDGSVVWRWKVSRPPIPDPALVDFSREHKNVKIVGDSPDDLRRQFLKLQEEGWAIHSQSKVITDDDGTVGQGLKVSRPQSKEAEKLDTCVHNLYRLRQAIHQWALDNGKSITNRVTLTDLECYFRNHEQFPACPSGETYSVYTVWDPPECNIPGHSLMQPFFMWKLEYR